ncbi:hypothetical protein [Neomoorella humiferrea]
MGDNCLTAVLIDRLIHHAHILAYNETLFGCQHRDDRCKFSYRLYVLGK